MSANRRVDWNGVFTAIITPFDQDGSLNESGLRQLINRQLDGGVDGLVPCGTTGESPALNHDEWRRVIQITIEEAKGKAWIVAGTGTNNTSVSIEKTLDAYEMGVDGALVITPYYNKPTQSGLVRHFTEISNAVPQIPIMVYNVPGRTGVNMTPDTLATLVELENIAAYKAASGNLAQIWEVARRFGDKIAVFSGDDGINQPIWEIGGIGTVSVVSNVVPDIVKKHYQAHISGNRKKALEYHDMLSDLASVLFIEANPAPAKFAMNKMGLPAGTVRSPLVAPGDESCEIILDTITGMSLLS
jgi:4-hydroxy-tetrahydrodipicolinate synthase